MANRYVILEISPLATDKSLPSPLAFSAAENREDTQARKHVKRSICSQYLLRDLLSHVII